MPLRARLRQRKNGSVPWSQIDEQAASREVVTAPVIALAAELILEAPLLSGEICNLKAYVALALIRRIVDRNNERRFTCPLPAEGDEAIVCPVAIPGSLAFQQLPGAVT